MKDPEQEEIKNMNRTQRQHQGHCNYKNLNPHWYLASIHTGGPGEIYIQSRVIITVLKRQDPATLKAFYASTHIWPCSKSRNKCRNFLCTSRYFFSTR